MRKHMLFATAAIFSAICLAGHSLADDMSKVKWKFEPNYQTKSKSNDLFSYSITDDGGLTRKMYDASYAVIISEGNYVDKSWINLSSQAKDNAELIKSQLEKDGFKVFLWNDLTGEEMKAVMEDVVSGIGQTPNARLFFYYFGHGTVVDAGSDDLGPVGYLVPVDAPSINSDEYGFKRRALPISRFREYGYELGLKHAFFALEACRAGSLFSTLGGPRPPNPHGYVFGNNIQKHVIEFLTAGNSEQNVPANGLFTSILVKGMSEADRTQSGFVTGTDLIEYVRHSVPTYAGPDQLNPESAIYAGLGGSVGGDIIIGRSTKSADEKSAVEVSSKSKTHSGPIVRRNAPSIQKNNSPTSPSANTPSTPQPRNKFSVVGTSSPKMTSYGNVSDEHRHYLISNLPGARTGVRITRITWAQNDNESFRFSRELTSIFDRAGFAPEPGVEHPHGPDETGILIFVADVGNPPDYALSIKQLLSDAGIQSNFVYRENVPEGVLTIFVGPLPD